MKFDASSKPPVAAPRPLLGPSCSPNLCSFSLCPRTGSLQRPPSLLSYLLPTSLAASLPPSLPLSLPSRQSSQARVCHDLAAHVCTCAHPLPRRGCTPMPVLAGLLCGATPRSPLALSRPVIKNISDMWYLASFAPAIYLATVLISSDRPCHQIHSILEAALVPKAGDHFFTSSSHPVGRTLTDVLGFPHFSIRDTRIPNFYTAMVGSNRLSLTICRAKSLLKIMISQCSPILSLPGCALSFLLCVPVSAFLSPKWILIDIGLMRGKLFMSTARSCPPWVGIRCPIIKESEWQLGGAQGLTVSGKYCGRRAGVWADVDNILKIVVLG